MEPREVRRGGQAGRPRRVGARPRGRLPDARARRRAARSRRSTAKERATLAGMAEGRSNAAIARDLGISERPVQRHIVQLLAKLDLRADGEGHRRVLAVLTYLREHER